LAAHALRIQGPHGHDTIIDPGHDASIALAGAVFLTADHLLFT
jgi:hypothetical protein